MSQTLEIENAYVTQTQFLCYQSSKRMNTEVDRVVSGDILICGCFVFMSLI